MTLWLRWNPGLMEADLDRDGGNLTSDDGLETAVVMSLFTDRRALDTDELPDGTGDRRGFWGDAYPDEDDDDEMGSRLWLLARSKSTQQALIDARRYALEALQWMIDDGVAQSVSVTSERSGNDMIALGVTIERPDDSLPRWQSRWEVPYAIR